ncbi:ABC transporter substrate-binding protein [Cupriavidus taiwanensis]|uniref:Extracellular solute-binding protein family 3 n=1 Tax=Cupriavidus taiwanensis TaxID=164546 RepID=A0A7Z7JFE0_9BURK|nr:ABC transporter substrate-binding protein [Cupriavidus taiwanensis]SOZ17186.1 Extracellular solute-binding protein family 3 [Cupriavidus taiwanensis]SOZ96500.1 Extracellular solute-binding protein family 3 [Cupriavidus taiwanensis]SPC25569.1 Extracellular solute-binding protein family 3 [Cupriavidus taiwanensis]
MKPATIAKAVAALGLISAVSAYAQSYGNCVITGQKGSIPIKPFIPGQLTVQTVLPAPGWYNGDTTATIKDGFEYCMAANIAYRAGLDKLVIQNVSRDALMTGRTKDFDLALAVVSITPERKKVVNFSVPYFKSNIGVLVKSGSKVTEENIRSKRIGVRQATAGYTYATTFLKPTEPLKVFADTTEVFTALAAGQVDVAMSDTSYLLGQAAKSNGMMKVVAQYSSPQEYGAVFPAGSANEAAINKAIEEMKADGTLASLEQKQLGEKWGTSPAAIPFWKP